jgi:hypothetical protein
MCIVNIVKKVSCTVLSIIIRNRSLLLQFVYQSEIINSFFYQLEYNKIVFIVVG